MATLSAKDHLLCAWHVSGVSSRLDKGLCKNLDQKQLLTCHWLELVT